MITELHELQNRYDDLLMIKDKTPAQWAEISMIEQHVRQIIFPTPRREDYDAVEMAEFWAERHAFENANPDYSPFQECA